MRWLLLLNLRYTDEPEKDKRKEKPSRESWMHTRGYVMVFCALFFITGLANIFILPSIGEYGVYKVEYISLLMITGLILGFPVAAGFLLLHSFQGMPFITEGSLYLLPSTPEHVKNVLLLVIMTVVLFLLIRQLQKFRCAFKWGVYLNYIPHALVMLWFTRPFIDGLVGKDYLRGDAPVFTPAAGIQITDSLDYDQTRGLWDTWYTGGTFLTHYYISHDDGQTRREFMLGTFRRNPGSGGLVQNSGQFNEQFFWLWQGKNAVFTHDSGETWTLWEGYDPDGSQSWYGSCFIVDISFTDEQRGKMTCHYVEFTRQMMSDDGGLTWHEAQP